MELFDVPFLFAIFALQKQVSEVWEAITKMDKTNNIKLTASQKLSWKCYSPANKIINVWLCQNASIIQRFSNVNGNSWKMIMVDHNGWGIRNRKTDTKTVSQYIMSTWSFEYNNKIRSYDLKSISTITVWIPTLLISKLRKVKLSCSVSPRCTTNISPYVAFWPLSGQYCSHFFCNIRNKINISSPEPCNSCELRF